MTITATNIYRQTVCDAGVNLVDGGTGATGSVIIETAGGDPIVTIPLENPAFGNASGTGVATAAGLPLSATSTPGGVCSRYRVLDTNDAEIWRGTCGTGAPASMILASVTIPAGADVTILSWTHSVPASP